MSGRTPQVDDSIIRKNHKDIQTQSAGESVFGCPCSLPVLILIINGHDTRNNNSQIIKLGARSEDDLFLPHDRRMSHQVVGGEELL